MLRAFEIGALRIRASDRREWQILLSLLLSISEQKPPEERFDELAERLGGAGVSSLEIERATQPRPGETEQERRRPPSGCTPRASRSPRT